eukprot:TRINITY_DN3523_c0_g1_i2.p1 TRINITY_DN3523_c0_g1~~TRINITY_DN3523_c0_g1_i2.p1  ORF type:complete len:110 (-),score=5.46 TRINITY_DN3523_c0_g1_i2:282-611(-)
MEASWIVKQYFWKNRCLEDQEAKKLFSEAMDATGSQGVDFDEFMSAIKKDLASFSLELKRVRRRTDGKIFWVLYNTVNDMVSQHATTLSIQQLNCFRNLVKNHTCSSPL